MGLVFSGVQPTGNLHLGNYLGAIKNWVALQEQHKSIFCIVDLHAITVHQDPKELSDSILKVAALYIACGIDPKKSIIFNQSRVSGHSELAWVLGCNTPIGWLNRMTQFKDKAGKDKEKASLGLYGYPVLMAADILLYNATHVPVGDDQRQHLELARDIAAAFNRDFGVEHFSIPEPLIMGTAARVMSLRDGTKKMSKSDPSEFSRINLTDDADMIRDKVKRAQTDSIAGISYNIQERPGVSNLLSIVAALSGRTAEDIAKEFENSEASKFKAYVADVMVEKLTPIKAEYDRLINDKIMLMKVLDEGAAKANDIARPIMQKTKEIVGFI